jgi:hypothetical protein
MFLAETSPLATSALTTQEAAPAVIDYARALRAIGQDLTELFPRVLELETDGTTYEARGQSHANPFHHVKERSFRRLWNNLFCKESITDRITPVPPALTFTRTYSAEDIERLDRLYGANRTAQGKRPDNYSLAERLRTMGSIVNSRKGRLKQLRKDADHLFVEYWDQDGQIQSAKLTTVILYRNQQPYLSPNGADAPKELWEGYDF